jgi:excinuclease ABC subunit A
VQEFDPDLVVPDPTVPFTEAIEPWRRNGPRMNMYYARAIRQFAGFFKLKPSVPFDELPAKIRTYLMQGIPASEREALGAKFEGVLPNLKRRFEESESEFVKERLLAYMSASPCPGCAGKRLRPASLAVKLRSGTLETGISDVTAMSIERAVGFFASLTLGAMQAQVAQPILKEIDARLGFLASVGLGYLTLERAARSPAARRSASDWPRRWEAAWWAWPTCWTSRRSACTSATTTGCWRHCGASQTSATPCWWSSMTRT